jgi:hypothetical protein
MRTSEAREPVQCLNESHGQDGRLSYSPFRRDERDLQVTEEDARFLEGEPVPLTILVKVEIECTPMNG